MMSHKYRLLGIVLFALLEAGALLAPLFGWLDEATATGLAKAIAGMLVTVGIVDASLVERARRDPTRPALPDDVIAPRTPPPPDPPISLPVVPRIPRPPRVPTIHTDDEDEEEIDHA